MKFQSIISEVGQSIPGLAATYLKNPLYFREICDQNQLNPIADSPLPMNIPLKIPALEAIAPLAASKLDKATGTINAIKGKVNQVGRLTGQISGDISDVLTSVDKVLPTQYRGYTKAALDAIADVNGAIGEVESTLTSTLEKIDKSLSKVRNYGGDRVALVDWLLS